MAADVWSVGPVPSGSVELMYSGRQRRTEGRKGEWNMIESVDVIMPRLLALVVWSALCGIVVAGCEQQAAGSGGVGAVLGGVVVWLWHRCRRSQCWSTVDSGRGLVHLDLELGENACSEGSAGEDGTPV